MATATAARDISGDQSAPQRRGWVLAVVLVACAVPLVVATVALARRGWTPIGEFAQAELRLRDFWAHPPTLGAVGRLRTETDVSSHPGPAAWWAMYPFYGLFGRSAVALSSSVAAAAAAWMSAAVLLAWRKGGDPLAFLLGIGVLGLFWSVGPEVFLEPWNPWFALMPFLCLLIAVWVAADGGPWALVVVAAAGTYCIQAHFGYTPLVGLLGLAALVGTWWSGPRRGAPWRSLLVPVSLAVGISALMWLPPLIEQLTGDPGNLGIMLSAYSGEVGREAELGVGGAIRMVAAYIDPVAASGLLGDMRPARSSPGPGTVILVGAWVASALLVWKRREQRRFASAGVMMAVLAVGFLGALVAASRIPGDVFGYLVLWLLPLVTMVVVCILWTAWLLLAVDRPEDGRSGLRWTAAMMLVLVLASVTTTISFAHPEVPSAGLSEVADDLVAGVLDSLPGDGPYMVRWDDPLAFGGLGTAVLSELERNGVQVGVDERLSTEMRPHRVLAPDSTDGAIWVITGAAIEQWEELDDAVLLAESDPRTEEQVLRSAELRESILAELDSIGAHDLTAVLDQNHWVVRTDPRVDPELRRRIDELTELGLPTAVFLVSTFTPQPAPR